MSKAKVSMAKDPDWIAPDALDWEDIDFFSEIFQIDSLDRNGDKGRYEKLMSSMFPFSPESCYQLNPNGNAVTKTWTKDGDLLIHVEYIKFPEEDNLESADNREY